MERHGLPPSETLLKNKVKIIRAGLLPGADFVMFWRKIFMPAIRITGRARDEKRNRPKLCLRVREREVEAIFNTEERPALIPSMQDVLFDTFLRNIDEIPPPD